MEEPTSSPLPPPPSVSSPSSSDNEDEDESSAYPDTQLTYSEEITMKTAEPTSRKPAKPIPKPVNKSNNENQPLKRGQRARLKKIKEKYKDQDEEDRIVRMQLLGSAGNESKKKQPPPPKTQNKENNKKKPQPPPPLLDLNQPLLLLQYPMTMKLNNKKMKKKKPNVYPKMLVYSRH